MPTSRIKREHFQQETKESPALARIRVRSKIIKKIKPSRLPRKNAKNRVIRFTITPTPVFDTRITGMQTMALRIGDKEIVWTYRLVPTNPPEIKEAQHVEDYCK